jgi:hypothetical protein
MLRAALITVSSALALVALGVAFTATSASARPAAPQTGVQAHGR